MPDKLDSFLDRITSLVDEGNAGRVIYLDFEQSASSNLTKLIQTDLALSTCPGAEKQEEASPRDLGCQVEGITWKERDQRPAWWWGQGWPAGCWVASYLTSSLMTLREGVNSPLMKFAEDIKLEGVVNTNEDSKVVQGDLLSRRTLARNCSEVWG